MLIEWLGFYHEFHVEIATGSLRFKALQILCGRSFAL